MMMLPDAIFCHKFKAILGKEIKHYLFDKDFKVTGIICAPIIFIIVTLAFIVALGTISIFLTLSHTTKISKVHIQETLDIMLESYLCKKNTHLQKLYFCP